MEAAPATPTGAGTNHTQPQTKRARHADAPDPNTFDGVLLEVSTELDKNNDRLKSKDYVTLMASMELACNRARRQIIDRHKNMTKKGETIDDMKKRLPFTKGYDAIEITKPYTAANRATGSTMLTETDCCCVCRIAEQESYVEWVRTSVTSWLNTAQSKHSTELYSNILQTWNNQISL